ncbi:hypothetical protein ABTK13_23515, partial [Acinetobacter baumannii]
MTTIATPTSPIHPPLRPEYERELEPFTATAVARALPLRQRLWQSTALRRAVILVVLAALWETVARL